MCEAGAAPQAPSGVAPNPVSTAVAAYECGLLPAVPVKAMAVLTTYEAQAVFRLLEPTPDLRAMTYGGLFRLRRGSRGYPSMGKSS